MQDIVQTLCALAGVRHAGIYKNSELISSNFPDTNTAAMTNSSHVVSQIFSALESVNKSHNELYFGIESGYLAAFKLQEGHVALLLTDKKINVPMISMAIKAASQTIKQQAKEAREEQNRLIALSEPSTVIESDQDIVPVEESLRPIFDRYTRLLATYLGPAASVIVDDAIDEWKKTYQQTPNNLPYLVAILGEELETEKERQQFSAKAAIV